MIARFDTWERASFFALEMQAEGRHAVILDQAMGLMWGPLAVGGVRVAVSDIVLNDDGEWPEIEAGNSEAANLARGLITALALMGPLLLLVKFAMENERPTRSRSGEMDLQSLLTAMAGCGVIIVLLSPLMPAFTRFLRDDSREASWWTRAIVAAHVILMEFCMTRS
ncbi:hypothetical protein OKA04_04000 [Luteolibacter flavescens]|uniref:Uncharacterized protein n=1 Tax=Luteolibacter flavescens TaxID=1859460 RepID=A0ABT3FK05_9BACT|nr:hypothetical protein [Luteolibacter flavescens]MCW1883876.1 hypothetical protein [Luteolibacter flavescens]